MVKNYELKCICLNEGLHKVAGEISKKFFIGQQLVKKAIIMNNFDKAKAQEISKDAISKIEYSRFILDASINQYGAELMTIAHQLNHNQYERKIYLKNRIKDFFFTKKCYFITLTFNDNTLKNTSAETRRRYVARFLKTQSLDYVANIDYGKKNEREHYHAITTEIADYNDWQKYGFISVKPCRNQENDLERIAKYINKLTNHAFKSTTKQNRIIYSKGFKN